MECGQCGGALTTSLGNWNEYAASERLPLVARELLDSYRASNPLDWFITHLILLSLVAALALGIDALLSLRLGTARVVAIAALGTYPALIVFRLVRRIAICKRFARTGAPPVWH